MLLEGTREAVLPAGKPLIFWETGQMWSENGRYIYYALKRLVLPLGCAADLHGQFWAPLCLVRCPKVEGAGAFCPCQSHHSRQGCLKLTYRKAFVILLLLQ